MNEAEAEPGPIWPSPTYRRQVERLRAAIGQTVYLIELASSEVQLGVCNTGRGLVLLDVLRFPQPDPARGLAPDYVLLDDGRGVNLGRIARISLVPHGPSPSQVLYCDERASDALLFGDRRLSQELIAERSRSLLGQVLGKREAPRAPVLTAMGERHRDEPVR